MTTTERIDQAVEFLQSKGFSIVKIAEKLEVTRAGYYSWRGSIQAYKLAQLETKIKEKFAEELKELPGAESETTSGDKYTKLLERSYEDMREEKTQLAAEVKALLERNAKLTETLEKVLRKYPLLDE